MGNILNKYEYFLAIVSHGSITKAAESLYIAQPSLTQYLKKLEKDIGAVLINRETSPLSLTPAGEVYYRYVLKHKRLTEEFEEEFSPMRSAIQGSLKIGIPITLQPFFTKDLVLPFAGIHPAVSLSMNGGTSPTLERMTSRGMLAASIIHITEKNYDNLEYRPIRDDLVLIVCSRDHRLVRGKKATADDPVPVSIEELRNELFYLMEPSMILRQVPEKMFRQTGIYPTRVMEMTDVATALSLCADGSEGLAFMPMSFCSIFDKTDRLAFMKLKEGDIMFRFVFCYRKGEQSPQTKAFVDFVDGVLSNDPFPYPSPEGDADTGKV